VDNATGGSEVNAARTSDGMFFERGEHPLIDRIERRIAALVRWPVENGEGLQVLRYRPGAEYRPHHDYFDPAHPGTAAVLQRGGQRVGTLVMYLNTPQGGGATTFPDVGLDVAPVKGNAVFFSYDRPHASTRTLHGGAPGGRREVGGDRSGCASASSEVAGPRAGAQRGHHRQPGDTGSSRGVGKGQHGIEVDRTKGLLRARRGDGRAERAEGPGSAGQGRQVRKVDPVPLGERGSPGSVRGRWPPGQCVHAGRAAAREAAERRQQLLPDEAGGAGHEKRVRQER
jgi:hypothetical protein